MHEIGLFPLVYHKPHTCLADLLTVIAEYYDTPDFLIRKTCKKKIRDKT